MSDGVHLLIPFAAPASEPGRQALRSLALPTLQRLLSRMTAQPADEGDAHTLSMPHERVLARAFGLFEGDGRIAWAAWQVHQAGRGAGNQAWAWITPCHWRVGRDHIAMDLPQQLQLDAGESRALLAAMQPFFEEDGIALEYDAPMLWLARGEIFRELPCASTDRVMGRRVDHWLPRTEAARPVRRLQQEMQMLLYTHPVNDERERGGLLPVNSFWVSGAGALPPSHAPAPPAGLQITHLLRDAALRDDWPAWTAAWQQLDTQEMPRLLAALERGESVRLTLCGERRARTWSFHGKTGLRQRISSLFRSEPASTLFEEL